MLELTDGQCRALDQCPGVPLEVIDPRTRRRYLVVAADQYPRRHDLGESVPEDPPIVVPPMILRAQAAVRRDLPELLRNKKLRGKFIAYAGDERIGIADDDADLIREIIRRGIPEDHYFIWVIEPGPVMEEEEVEYGLLECDDDEPAPRGAPSA